MGYKFGPKFQKLLLKYVIEKKKLSYLNLLFPKLFDENSLEIIFRYVKDYYRDYRSIPSYDKLRRNAGGLYDIGMEENIPESKNEIIKMIDQVESMIDENEEETQDKICDFIKMKRADKLFTEMLEDRARGEYNLDGYTEVLNKIRFLKGGDTAMNYYDARLIEKYFEDIPTIPTGFDQLDKWLKGGLQLGEIGIVAGKSGVGKTFFLLNMAAHAYKKGYDVIYVTLEISKMILKRRFDSCITGMSWEEIIADKERYYKVMEEKYQGGDLIIVHFPEGIGSVEDIREKVLELKENKKKDGRDFIPNLLMVDFLENLNLNMYGSTSHDRFEGLGLATAGLRRLGAEENMAVWVAQQIQRGGYKLSTVRMENIQSSIKIVSVVDLFLGLSKVDRNHPDIKKIQIDKIRRAAMPDVYSQIRLNGDLSKMTEMSYDEIKEMRKENEEESENKKEKK